MSEKIDVEVPGVGESISEVQIGRWLKQPGEWVREGEDLVEIETEKASVQIPSPASGVLEEIAKTEEEFAEVGEKIGVIRPGEPPADGGSPGKSGAEGQPVGAGQDGHSSGAAATTTAAQAESGSAPQSATGAAGFVMPAAQRLLSEHGIQAEQVPATGPGGRLLKEDVLAFIRNRPATAAAAPETPAPPRENRSAGGGVPAAVATPSPTMPSPGVGAEMAATGRATPPTSLMTEASLRNEEVKPMSMLRRTIAARLVEAQQTAALLTTFNEVDMQPVMKIRSKYKDAFLEKHGVKLGFMSFFAKAAVESLRRFPAVNAEIRDGNLVYRNYQDIGIAIGGGKGLVVPILRNVERMSFADIEHSIGEYARQAKENRLQPGDLMGGTFTISNGGIYGSLLSTPIVNPPQSGILGLHSIQERPVAIDGQVAIRPMMYLALTYDHRVVDGREAVGFLKTIKEVIEDPARLFLEV